MEQKVGFINVGAGGLVVDLSANTSNTDVFETITFSSDVRGGTPPFSYLWNFGDGTTSTSTNPAHQYNMPGSYTVSLLVEDAMGDTDFKTKTNLVEIYFDNVNSPLTADFFSSPNSGNTQTSIKFFDQSYGSTGPPYNSYFWDFGDGTTSNLQNPSKIYSSPGWYSVTLTITDRFGVRKTMSKYDHIYIIAPVPAPILADFEVSRRQVNASDGPVIFRDKTTGNIDLSGAEYYWDFGRGAIPRYANTQGPHEICYHTGQTTYQNPILTVKLGIHSDTEQKANWIEVNGTNTQNCSLTEPGWVAAPGALSDGFGGNITGGVGCGNISSLIGGIENGDFENLACSYQDNVGDPKKLCPFGQNPICMIGPWGSSHGKPSYSKHGFGSNSDESLTIYATGFRAFIDNTQTIIGPRIGSEGIFYTHSANFSKAKTYILYFSARVWDPAPPSTAINNIHHLNIALTNGLVNNTNCSDDDENFLLPDYQFSIHELGRFQYNINTQWRCYSVVFTPPNNDFNQIWIYPYMEPRILTSEQQTAFIALDDFALEGTDYCPKNIYYANIDNIEPFSKSENLLIAENNVNIKSGQDVIFQGGKAVLLKPGFTAFSGSTFNAYVADCNNNINQRLADRGLNYKFVKEEANVTTFISPFTINNEMQNQNTSVNNLHRYKEPFENQKTKIEFEAFPNPSNSFINVYIRFPHLPGDIEISIHNALGFELENIEFDNQLNIDYKFDLKKYNTGIYFIKAKTNSGTLTKKVIIK